MTIEFDRISHNNMVDIRCLWDSHYSIPFIGYLPSSLYWFSIAAEANHCKLSHLKTNKTIILDSLGQKSNMSLTSVRRAAFFSAALDKNFFLPFPAFRGLPLLLAQSCLHTRTSSGAWHSSHAAFSLWPQQRKVLQY